MMIDLGDEVREYRDRAAVEMVDRVDELGA
jgi:hypothetical protein